MLDSPAPSLSALLVLHFPLPQTLILGPEDDEHCLFSGGPLRLWPPASGPPANSTSVGDAPGTSSSWGPDRPPRFSPPGGTLYKRGMPSLCARTPTLGGSGGSPPNWRIGFGIGRPYMLATPKFWSNFSSNEASRQRAHGQGVVVALEYQESVLAVPPPTWPQGRHRTLRPSV